MISLKKIARFSFILSSILIFDSFSAFSVPKKMVLGGEQGWSEIQKMSGLTKSSGRYGQESLSLVTSTQNTDDTTDLLLTFDNSVVRDSTGHYEVLSNRLSYTSDAVRGKGAAISRGVDRGISLKGDKNSIFGTTGLVGSFCIEFWLAPSLAENGETVLSWRSSLHAFGSSKYQMISASFFANHLQWKFNNIFSGYEKDEIILDGVSTIIPKKWSRHTISFDQDSGMLEYCVDGRTEAIKYITENGREYGTICEPNLGVTAKIEICPQYTGKIDNFRIDRKWKNVSQQAVAGRTGNEKYKVDGGSFVTKPILVSHSAVLDSLDAEMKVPNQTEVKFYVRSGDDCYSWKEDEPKWREVVPGQKINGVSGLYFQLMAELLPDGGGENSPNLTEVTLKYTEQDDPLPPFSIYAEPGDGCVNLSWSNSVDDCAGGYYVYYGNRPGEYLGVVAYEGNSPINVGNKTSLRINGLKNGTIYYFAVSTYSKIDSRITGELSKEVYARPSARLSSR